MNFSDIKILVFNLFVVTDGFLSVKIDTTENDHILFFHVELLCVDFKNCAAG